MTKVGLTRVEKRVERLVDGLAEKQRDPALESGEIGDFDQYDAPGSSHTYHFLQRGFGRTMQVLDHGATAHDVKRLILEGEALLAHRVGLTDVDLVALPDFPMQVKILGIHALVDLVVRTERPVSRETGEHGHMPAPTAYIEVARFAGRILIRQNLLGDFLEPRDFQAEFPVRILPVNGSELFIHLDDLRSDLVLFHPHLWLCGRLRRPKYVWPATRGKQKRADAEAPALPANR